MPDRSRSSTNDGSIDEQERRCRKPESEPEGSRSVRLGAVDPVCKSTSNWSWIAPSAAIRYTICLVTLSGSPVDHGRPKIGDGLAVADLVPVTGLRRSTSAGMVNTLMTLMLADPVHGSAVSSAPEWVVPSMGWPPDQYASVGIPERLDRLRRFKDGRYRPRGEVDLSQVVSGRHIDQSRRQVPADRAGAPTALGPNRSRSAPSSSRIVRDQRLARESTRRPARDPSENRTGQ